MAASDAAVKSDSADGEAQFVTLPGCGFSGLRVMKMVGVFPQNAVLEPPQPAVQRLMALFDGERPARPFWRGSDGARQPQMPASSRPSWRGDAEELLIVGAGRSPRTSPNRTWRRLPQSSRLLGPCGFWLRLYASARTRARKARVRSCCGCVSTSTGRPCSTITPPSMKIR
jgi:hypothetical protein